MLTRILFCTAMAVGSTCAMAQATSADAPDRANLANQSAGKPVIAKKSPAAGGSSKTAAAASKHRPVKPKLATAKVKRPEVPAKSAVLTSPAVPSAGSRMKVAVRHLQGASAIGSSGAPSSFLAARPAGSSNEIALNHGSSETFPSAISTEPVIPPDEAYARARLLDGERHTALALPLYHDASRQGHGEASLRLMEIYSIGAEGVSRNYLAAVEFKRLAMQQGITIEYPPRR